MEFLVQIQVTLPPELSSGSRQELMGREQVRGRELMNEGVIRRIWRIPGRTANVGIWDAAEPYGIARGPELAPDVPVYRRQGNAAGNAPTRGVVLRAECDLNQHGA